MGLLDTEVSLKKIINFCETDNIEGLKNYVKKKDLHAYTFSNKKGKSDLLVIAILKNYSLEFINIIIDLYKDLNYTYSYNNSSFLSINYPFKKSEVSPLFVAIARNEFDIANLLLQNNADINYEYLKIFQNLINEELVNIENLKFILNNGIIISDILLRKIVYQWIIDGKDDLLKVIFKYYIINRFYELKNIKINRFRDETEPFIETVVQKLINNENYRVLEFFIKNSADKEEEFLNILFDVFENCNNDDVYDINISIGKKHYYKYYSMENNIKETNHLSNNDKKIKFLNSIDNNELKLKLEKFLSRRKDIIEILKRNDLTEFQKFINENDIILKKLNNKKFDILITAIEYSESVEVINYIITKVNYNSLDYCFYDNNNKYECSFEKNIPLFTAIAKNKFDIANLLLQNKANMSFDLDYKNNFNIFQYLKDQNVMNKENLKYILNYGIKIDKKMLEETVYQYVLDAKNDLLEVIFKYYIISNFDELNKIKINNHWNEAESFFEKVIQKAVNVENYKIIEFFIRESADKEEEILNILSNTFEYGNNDDINSHYSNYNTTGSKNISNDDKKIKFLNSIDNEKLKIKIEKFLLRRKNIIEILKRNDLEEIQKFINENNIVLKNLNNKNFDILIAAIEYCKSSEIISYIINQVNYNSLDYRFHSKNNVYEYSYKSNIPLFTAIAKNKFEIANLLLQNKANMNINLGYNNNINIFLYLKDQNVMNKENLKFILNKGIINNNILKYTTFQGYDNILNNEIKIKDEILEETIYQWISDGKNDLLEVIFKYIINHFDELKNIKVNRYEKEPFLEKVIKKALNAENFKIIESLIKDNNDKEVEFLYILSDVFESYNNDDMNKRNFYYNYSTIDRNKSKIKNKNSIKIKFLNSIDNKELKNKIEKFLSRRKDIIEILKKNNLTEFQKFINENNIVLKNLNNKNFDILISAIECGVSNEIINHIINKVNYDTLDYCFNNENEECKEYEYSFKKNIPLFTAIAKNKFDIADFLLQNKASMNFDGDYNNFNIFEYLKDQNVMNKENLKYILNNGTKTNNNILKVTPWKPNYIILKNGIKIDNEILEEMIYRWISDGKNDLLKVIFKYYIINHFDELKDLKINRYGNETKPFFEKMIQKLINVENYNIIEFFINESANREEDILKIIFDVFECGNNNDERKYNRYRYITNNKDKKIKFLNSIDNEKLKNKIEKFLSRRKDIIKLLKRNNLIELKKYITENSIILKNLNNKKFDILITAIECDVSNEIINYIINQVNYSSLNYCLYDENNKCGKYNKFDYYFYNENNDDNECDEYKYNFKKNIPLFTAIANNKFDIANLLLQNNANMDFNIDYENYNIFQYLNDQKVMNKKNLKYILNNNIEIDNIILKDTIYQWISYDKNDLLEVIFKYYIILNFDELKNIKIDYYSNKTEPFIERLIQKVVNNENYNILEFFIRNSFDKENEILNIISNNFDSPHEPGNYMFHSYFNKKK